MAEVLSFTNIPHNREKLYDEVVAAAVGPYPIVFSTDEYNETVLIHFNTGTSQTILDDVTDAVNNHIPVFPDAPTATDGNFLDALNALVAPTAQDVVDELVTWLTAKGVT